MNASADTQELERALADFIPRQRWYRTKSEGVKEVRMLSRFALPHTSASFCIVEVDRKHVYALVVRGSELDALDDETLRAFLRCMAHREVLHDGQARLQFNPLRTIPEEVIANVAPKVLKGEQTNSSVLFGQFYVGKIVRKLDEGASPDLDMGRFLTEAGYAHTPALVGYVELEREGHEPATVALLHAFVANEGDAWTHALASDLDPSYATLAELLGRRVGEMHAALASRPEDPAFAPEPLGADGVAALLATAKKDFAELAARTDLSGVDAGTLFARLEAGLSGDAGAAMRVHGDLHLGQVLFTGTDFVILDFEGEPARPLAERKARRSPLADVAGMLRSFDYAAAVAVKDGKDAARARSWRDAASSAFVAGYRAGLGTAAVLPNDPTALLDLFLLEKCLYELRYELDNRPDWVAIPAGGLRDIAKGRTP